MNAAGVLADSVATQLDETPWIEARTTGAVRVYSSTELPAPVRGYRTVCEPGADARSVADFLGTRMLDAFAVLNRRFAFAETLIETPWTVRTGFTMPPGFRRREFVHSVVRHEHQGVHFVIYGPVDESGLPAPREGFIRCPMYLSGQRITPLSARRCRVEHLMIYELGGLVPRWAQNTIFHAGHVDAYVDEWSRLLLHFADGDTLSAPTTPSPATSNDAD